MKWANDYTHVFVILHKVLTRKVNLILILFVFLEECENDHFDICTNKTTNEPVCLNEGICYPCSIDWRRGIDLCDKEEVKRGFRCICPTGLKPPFCAETIKICESHRCLNNAICLPNNQSELDYK